MSRKGKNTCNTTKSKTTPVKSKNSTAARPEQPNIDEAEEIDLKRTSRECLKFLERK